MSRWNEAPVIDESLGYQSAQAWQQAKELYPQMQGVLSGKQTARPSSAAGLLPSAHTAPKPPWKHRRLRSPQRQYTQEWHEAMAAATQARGAIKSSRRRPRCWAFRGASSSRFSSTSRRPAREQTQHTLRDASETEMELAAAERATEATPSAGIRPPGGFCPCQNRQGVTMGAGTTALQTDPERPRRDARTERPGRVWARHRPT